MFRKILVANRGEIAIRAFRAAYELGARTVAVFPYEDRGSLHRQKADESYVIGEPGHPVRAYLDVDEIIRVALESGADAIYPGYGFLSENPELAARAAENGITFIGPPSTALEMAGNKVTAKHHAIAAGVPVLRSTDGVGGRRRARRAGGRHRIPDLRQGRRRRRRARHAPRRDAEALPPAIAEAMREAGAAFGDAARVPRAGGRASAPHRGADPRRRDRPHRSPVRARLLRAAAPPEGHRDRAGAEPRRRAARSAPPRRRRLRRSRSGTSTPAPSSSSSTRRGSAPASTSSSR